MESRIRSIFLAAVSGAVLMAVVPASAQTNETQPPQVIDPDVERRAINAAAIDTEDFELTGFVGFMSVEDFETNAVYGARLAYHINDALFAEAAIGQTDVGDSSAEKLGNAKFFDDRTLTYYDASLGWNLLPSESFLGANRAYNSTFYVIGGAGSTDFADDSNFTINLGFGFKILPTDYLAIRIEARSYMFDTEVNAEDKTLTNMQGTLNVSWFF
jgi:outer membrane beta-barrel protein